MIAMISFPLAEQVCSLVAGDGKCHVCVYREDHEDPHKSSPLFTHQGCPGDLRRPMSVNEHSSPAAIAGVTRRLWLYPRTHYPIMPLNDELS